MDPVAEPMPSTAVLGDCMFSNVALFLLSIERVTHELIELPRRDLVINDIVTEL